MTVCRLCQVKVAKVIDEFGIVGRGSLKGEGGGVLGLSRVVGGWLAWAEKKAISHDAHAAERRNGRQCYSVRRSDKSWCYAQKPRNIEPRRMAKDSRFDVAMEIT